MTCDTRGSLARAMRSIFSTNFTFAVASSEAKGSCSLYKARAEPGCMVEATLIRPAP